MYRLLAIDLDGTLLSPRPCKMVTPRTRLALQKAADAGIHIVIATGQNLAVLQQIGADLPLANLQIVENGAQIVDIRGGRIVHEKLLPAVTVLPVLVTLRQAGFHRAYHTRQRVYADAETPRVRQWYTPPVPPVIEIEDVTSLYPAPCIKIVAVGQESRLRTQRPALTRAFSQQAYVTQSAFDLLEFLHPAVSKRDGLLTVARELGIERAEIAAIGDGHNDIGMLQFAGLGIAMGNAHAEVKSQADYVTLSNAEDGVAVAIEQLILPARPRGRT